MTVLLINLYVNCSCLVEVCMFELIYIELGRREFQCCHVTHSMLETADTDGYGRHVVNNMQVSKKSVNK